MRTTRLPLLAWGDASYNSVLKDALGARDGSLYDVRTDVEVFSILGFYRSLCTEVTARAFAIAVSAAHR